MFSEEIRRQAVRQNGWKKNEWKGKVLAVLVFVVPSDMTRIEFKRKCDEVGQDSFAIGKVEREGEHFRVTLKPKASKEWQRMAAEKLSVWARRLGCGVCVANGLAKLRRSPRVGRDKGRQRTVRGSEGMGEKIGDVEQTKTKSKTETETERKLKQERV